MPSEEYGAIAEKSEIKSLIGGSSDEIVYDPEYSTELLYRNFFAMSIAFSLNHGCVVSCLAYASAELGNEMGSVSSGILYVCYAITAFLFAKPIVKLTGSQIGLLLGVLGYAVYIGGFLFSVIFRQSFPDLAWTIMSITSAIGGISGGVLWTAQGRYFSRHATLFSQAARSNVENTNSDFAGLFAMMFLGIELCTKVTATLLYLLFSTHGATVVFTLYLFVTIATCLVVAGLNDLGDLGDWDLSYTSVSKEAGAAARLVYDDSRLALIVPFQIAFGLASSFVPYYVFGTVISGSANLGTSWVGILSALAVLSGAIAAVPSTWAAKKSGKAIVISVGGVCLALTGFAFFVFSDEQLGTWLLIVPLMLMFGVGRGIWENTNKAIIADFYSDSPDKCTSAFAATTFFNGYASAMGYFSFPYVTRLDMAGSVLMASMLSLTCYHYAFHVHNNLQAAKKIDINEVKRQHYLAYIAEHGLHDADCE